VDCFNRLQVLPGVEVSVYPNVHVILVFHPQVVSEVNDFLRNDMELGDAVDNGDPEVRSKHSVLVLLDKASARFSDKYFCILPHVESTKGVWQELDRSVRADIVKDDRILAAQFSNPETISMINQVMANPQYKRKTPLAFIQASDYHGSPNVKPASAYSILKVAQPFTYDSLRTVLSDPSCVRNCFEYVDEQLNDYVSGHKVLSFDFINNLDLTTEQEANICKALCALINTSNTLLLLNLKNVSETADKGGEVIAASVRCWAKKLDPPEMFNFQVAQFHQTNSRQRFCIKVTRNSKLRLFESLCWINDSGTVRPGKSWEIEHLVCKNAYIRFGKVNQDSLAAASTQILRVSSSFPAIPIATRLQELVSQERTVQLKGNLLKAVFSTEIGDDLGFNNGFADGDYYMYEPKLGLKGGRLGKQRDYFRFTAPVFPYRNRVKLETANVSENSLDCRRSLFILLSRSCC
jgi:hypothetical protein